MHFKRTLLILFTALFSLGASALTVPVATPMNTAFTDSTKASLPLPALKKKPGFFSRLTYKVATFVLRQAEPKEASSGMKNTLGWASLAMVAAGIGLGLAGSGIAAVVLIPAGIIAAIVSLIMKNEPASGKRASTAPPIITLTLCGALVALAIAWGGSSWH